MKPNLYLSTLSIFFLVVQLIQMMYHQLLHFRLIYGISLVIFEACMKYLFIYWSLAQDFMSELLGDGVPTSDISYHRVRLRVPTYIISAQRRGMHANETIQYQDSVNYI